MVRIESILSARLFVVPQSVGNYIYFLSNLSGHLSLYRMKVGGSVPEPLLPPQIALQNPDLMNGPSFVVFPELDKILVMIDEDGDENYQPQVIPTYGGYPELAFGDKFASERVHCLDYDLETNTAYLWAESREEALTSSYRANLQSGQVDLLGQSPYGSYIGGFNKSHDKAILIDAYGLGDHVIYINDDGQAERRLLYGIPLEDRQPDKKVVLNSISDCDFVNDDKGLLVGTSLFSDLYGLGYLDLVYPDFVKEVTINGVIHEGLGEFEHFKHLKGSRYMFAYNIDGCTWLYEGSYDHESLSMNLDPPFWGAGELSGGITKGVNYDKVSDRYVLSFTTATSPTQIYTIEGQNRDIVSHHTQEKVLGISDVDLSPGEDASFTSYDGLRISARLYLPAESLRFEGLRPVVYYVHGGPQSQEHPDFAWFSMPLIQFLSLNGIAVFVPNVRGSSGYGFEYMKRVERDWGGADRMDHVHAMTEILSKDERLDVGRAGVVGRSYGGFMTLTLAARHPELWSAAVDMFGPYDLPAFGERLPESWKPFFKFMLGDPQEDREFLIERSPRTYIDSISCPLMVIQGKNDPRVIEQESRELVEELRAQGKEVEYLMFEDEGHDILKFENRVRCYNGITDFFKKKLKP